MKQCVYITGGSSGIGLGLAHYYAQAGDDITLLARDQAKLAKAVDSCEKLAAVRPQRRQIH